MDMAYFQTFWVKICYKLFFKKRNKQMKETRYF